VFRKYTKMNKVSGMDMDTPSWATRTEQGRNEVVIFVSNVSPTTRGAIGGTGTVREVRAIRDAYVLGLTLSLKEVGFLSGLIISGPGSKYTYFERGSCRGNITCSPMSSYPIRGQTSLIGRAENRPCSLSTVLWGTPWSMRNHLIRRLLVLSSRSSHGWCPGLEVRTTYRAYSGSVGCLHVSLGQLSQISGADSAVSSTSVHMGLSRPPAVHLN
jgi:hypothetical protein